MQATPVSISVDVRCYVVRLIGGAILEIGVDPARSRLRSRENAQAPDPGEIAIDMADRMRVAGAGRGQRRKLHAFEVTRVPTFHGLGMTKQPLSCSWEGAHLSTVVGISISGDEAAMPQAAAPMHFTDRQIFASHAEVRRDSEASSTPSISMRSKGFRGSHFPAHGPS